MIAVAVAWQVSTLSLVPQAGSAEIVELLLLIGYFRMISGVMTTLDVDVEFPFGAEILASLSNGQ